MSRTGQDADPQVVAITGASSGIGWELARKLAADGAHVALIARRAERLLELEQEIIATGGVAKAFPCDLADAAAIESLPGRISEALGTPHVLVNNAGRGAHGAFEAVDMSTHRQVLTINLDSVIACTHAFVPQMLARGKGQVVFVSSVLGRLPAPEHAVYAASKWGVSGFAESLSYELEPRGIEVVLVEPGLVRSEFAAQAATPLVRYRYVPSKSSAQAAAEVRSAMRRNARHHIADRLVASLIGVKRHWPRIFRMIFAAAYRRAKRQS
ncbi:MAG: SDR family NAD(P)-dependent oxidoreductase [Gemmatimonadetes bacterium]|jgi:short-subunit dehydrogenase|nr:SDR family NAD(P)-dependent oxidoreductase [Gemmatimonadota bacterium]MBT5143691.1 SDR family NAD(P)-dependent oxidoreductase [Gemmatimonadota bacterium]MBT5588551.1 SDR family NAD(P)-dependent oxidoreductase [Gemmatimonadota bacterium]MBT5965671.1 SDR family NAD(P)-dependent oxidoreductase [Gemmatimonadota bacterium]MBT6625538.1 SDR family NAD(P)-dependent oxidoreductase [Gemmatimonadota bacterium]